MSQFDLTPEELRRRFDGIPDIVKVVEVALGSKKTFAHAEIETAAEGTRVIENLSKIYGKAMWKGGYLTFEEAKPNYLERRREADASNHPTSVVTPSATPQTWNESTKLRLRKKRGRKGILVVIPAKTKKRKFVVSEELPVRGVDAQKRMKEDSVRLKHMMSYCCTQDAGPDFGEGDRFKERVAGKGNVAATVGNVKCETTAASEEEDEAAEHETMQHNEELVLFVSRHCSGEVSRTADDDETATPSKVKRKKHVPGSLLYEFRKAVGLLQ